MKLTVILAGWTQDVASVRARLPRDCEIFPVTEATPDDCVLPNADIAIYVFTGNTGHSSQLLGFFSWIHAQGRPKEEYVLKLGPAETYFDFITRDRVQEISFDDLSRRLGSRSS